LRKKTKTGKRVYYILGLVSTMVRSTIGTFTGVVLALNCILVTNSSRSDPPIGKGKTSSPSFSLNDDFYTSMLSRSDPTWDWGMIDDDGNYHKDDGYGDRPTEWVNSLLGANGDLGYMLFSPVENELRIDVSKLTLWDDRT